jgi:hypothetical protein
MPKYIVAIAVLAILLPMAQTLAADAFHADDGEPPPFNYQPPEGVIPDQATAVQVGETILKAVYGKKVIEEEEPFKAILQNDIWYISGTVPPEDVGGTGEIYISKSKGCVVRLLHSQ